MTHYARDFQAGWGTMDFNGHMRNTAYLDFAADVRLMFFAEHGFPIAEFRRLGIGPVVRRDEVEYRREVHLLQLFAVTFAVHRLSADGARFAIRNDFFLEATLAARVTSSGGWLDLKARRLTAPPPALLAALQAAPRTEEFEAL
jgi:acyl-CoA thioester hydrolase